jgi:hypothetical protein
VHRIAVGHADITGDDFGGIFAAAISGAHRGKPLGIADVMWNDCAWSVKTVKAKNPFEVSNIRVISGRNSPSYSSDITVPFADIQATGRAILEIWNERVDIAAREHDDLRVLIMIRNMRTREFTLMEHEGARFVPSEYIWEQNKSKNLIGYDKTSRKQCFTWQHSGSQFTIHHHVPASAYCFRITKRPGMIAEEHILRLVKFEDGWIQTVPRVEPGKIIPLATG